MKFYDIVGVLIYIEYIYHINMKLLWNFKNGYSLNYNYKNMSERIRSIISLVALMNVSSIIQIILITAVIICGLAMYKYISVKNKTVNQNNTDLQTLYISEIKKDTRNVCICAIIIISVIIIVSIYF